LVDGKTGKDRLRTTISLGLARAALNYIDGPIQKNEKNASSDKSKEGQPE
jgi:hypothetical protein